MIREYKFPLLEKVLFGAGAVQKLPQEVERLGKGRAFILTGNTLSTKTDLVRKLQAVLGERAVGTYDRCEQHVPSHTVAEAVEAARKAKADVIVSFGGGSAIDAGKLTALQLLGDRAHDSIPHIAIGTTLSASEFTPFAGMTDRRTGVKSVHRDPRIVPKMAIMDPEMTVATPERLWTATGIKALDHAIEAIWSMKAQPVTDALAIKAIEMLRTCLPKSIGTSPNIEARGECQVAAWLSIFGLANVGVRLSHIIGHQVGARWNVPHGITSCIALGPCMRFLAPDTLDRQVLIARAFGIDTGRLSPEAAAAAAATAVEAFIDTFGLPRRLRDVGAVESELPDLAHSVIEETSIWHDQHAGDEPLLKLLREMW